MRVPTDMAGKRSGAEQDVPFAGAGAGAHLAGAGAHLARAGTHLAGAGTQLPGAQAACAGAGVGRGIPAYPDPVVLGPGCRAALLASTGAPAGLGMGHPWLPVAGR